MRAVPVVAAALALVAVLGRGRLADHDRIRALVAGVDPSADRAGRRRPPRSRVRSARASAGTRRASAPSRRRQRRDQRALVDAVPDAADLLLLAAAGGANPYGALVGLARHGSGPVATAAAGTVAAVGLGTPLAAALDQLDALGPPARPLVDALLDADQRGAPLRPALARAGADARLARQRAAEVDARRLPVRLLFPLVLCTLPAFGLLTVVPLLARSLPSLTP